MCIRQRARLGPGGCRCGNGRGSGRARTAAWPPQPARPARYAHSLAGCPRPGPVPGSPVRLQRAALRLRSAPRTTSLRERETVRGIGWTGVHLERERWPQLRPRVTTADVTTGNREAHAGEAGGGGEGPPGWLGVDSLAQRALALPVSSAENAPSRPRLRGPAAAAAAAAPARRQRGA